MKTVQCLDNIEVQEEEWAEVQEWVKVLVEPEASVEEWVEVLETDNEDNPDKL